ncbi:MAG TPA: MFS transporter [Gammaproteobacteria bacterium]|nr:MFS transporter [Gammaproteobacteria bacterium]
MKEDLLKDAMTPSERQAMVALASIFALRMFGLFLILPVLTLMTHEISGATPFLIGIGVGIYGLTQAALQIPFGWWSDKIGRHAVLTVGLVLFLVGSLVGVFSDSMWGIIVARALQGAGAIAAVVMATAGDLIRPQHQSKAMAAIGMSIGLAFMLALVSGPVLLTLLELKGLFVLMAFSSLAALAILWLLVPTVDRPPSVEDRARPSLTLVSLLKRSELIRLDLGVFVLHFCLTALFLIVPLLLHQGHGLAVERHGYIYAGTILLSLFFMLPTLIWVEKLWLLRQALLLGIGTLILAQLILSLVAADTVWVVVLALVVFFYGFNLLEAMLPSLVSRYVSVEQKGLAMGIFSTSQFLGAFCGGIFGGLMFTHFAVEGVIFSCILFLLAWFVATWGMIPPTIQPHSGVEKELATLEQAD